MDDCILDEMGIFFFCLAFYSETENESPRRETHFSSHRQRDKDSSTESELTKDHAFLSYIDKNLHFCLPLSVVIENLHDITV